MSLVFLRARLLSARCDLTQPPLSSRRRGIGPTAVVIRARRAALEALNCMLPLPGVRVGSERTRDLVRSPLVGEAMSLGDGAPLNTRGSERVASVWRYATAAKVTEGEPGSCGGRRVRKCADPPAALDGPIGRGLGQPGAAVGQLRPYLRAKRWDYQGHQAADGRRSRWLQ